jgi:hypothetical protein
MITTGNPAEVRSEFTIINVQITYRLRKTHRSLNLHKTGMMCQGYAYGALIYATGVIDVFQI